MELDEKLFVRRPSGDSDEKSTNGFDPAIVSNDSISSALSALSEARSDSSEQSQDTCINVDVRNGNVEPNSNETVPVPSYESCPQVASPPRRRKEFLVQKVDEPKDEIDSKEPVDDLAPVFRPSPQLPQKVNSGKHDLPKSESEKHKPSSFRIRKGSRSRKRSREDSDLAETKREKKLSKDESKSSPSKLNRQDSLTKHKKSVENSESSPALRKYSDESAKKKNKPQPDSSDADEEDSTNDQLRELPKLKKPKSRKTARRVSYDDHVVKIPTPRKEDDDVFLPNSEEGTLVNTEGMTAAHSKLKQDEKKKRKKDENLLVPQLKRKWRLFRPHDQRIKVFLLILFFLIVGGVTSIWIFYKRQLYEVEIGKKIVFHEVTRTLVVREFGTDSIALKGVLGINVPETLPYLCSDEHSLKHLCLRWPDFAILNITYWDARDDIGCYDISWEKLSDTFIPKDCFSLDGAHWYGGELTQTQQWPLEKQQHVEMPHVTGNILNGEYGSVIQAYWLSSQGVSVDVPVDVPLWVGINASAEGRENGMCLSASYQGPYSQLSTTVGSDMRYKLCKGPKFKKLHDFMIPRLLDTKSVLPDLATLRDPGWSTWGKYSKNISQDKVKTLYEEIKRHNFSISHLEIYDKWEPNYGDLSFDPKYFPNPLQLVSDLAADGVEVMACVHPFVDTKSEIFQDGVRYGHFVMSEDDTVPGLTYRWNSVGAVVDFTSPDASDWYRSRLEMLRNKTGITSFRFDAGEVSWLPHKPHFSIPLINPLEYSKKYVEFAHSFGGKTIVASSYRSQNVPVIIRLHDLSPTWDYNNGLKSLIPTILTLNFLGYPYLQLQVGGGGDNFQGLKNESVSNIFPSRKLYLRTLQIAVFLPSFQFSVVPWQYDQEMTALAKSYIKFHQDFVLPKIQELFVNDTMENPSIIRPLWWQEDTEVVQTIDSEFLLGDDVLVAPILDEHSQKRDIYLPKGNWKDPHKEMTIEGGTWLRDYSVRTSDVPYFVRV